MNRLRASLFVASLSLFSVSGGLGLALLLSGPLTFSWPLAANLVGVLVGGLGLFLTMDGD